MRQEQEVGPAAGVPVQFVFGPAAAVFSPPAKKPAPCASETKGFQQGTGRSAALATFVEPEVSGGINVPQEIGCGRGGQKALSSRRPPKSRHRHSFVLIPPTPHQPANSASAILAKDRHPAGNHEVKILAYEFAAGGPFLATASQTPEIQSDNQLSAYK